MSKVKTKTPQPLCLEPLEVWACDRPVQHPSPGVLHLLDDVGTVVDDLSLHARFAAAGWVVRGLVWGAGAHAAAAHLLHSVCVYSNHTQQIHTVDSVCVYSNHTQQTQCLHVQQSQTGLRLCVQQPYRTIQSLSHLKGRFPIICPWLSRHQKTSNCAFVCSEHATDKPAVNLELFTKQV